MSELTDADEPSLSEFLGFKSFGHTIGADWTAEIRSEVGQYDFPVIEQEGDEWCWAAVTAAMEEFCNGNAIAQCRVVTLYRNAGYLTDDNGVVVEGDPCTDRETFDVQGKITSALKAVCAIKVLRRERNETPQPDIESFAIDHSNRSLPMPVMISYRDVNGQANNHYICIVGKAAGGGKFLIFDPAEGAGIFTKAIADLSSYDVSGNDGVWTNFYPWKNPQ